MRPNQFVLADLFEEQSEDEEEQEQEAEIDRRSRPYVSWLQRSLNRLLGIQLMVDGVIGPRTREAVRVFQQRLGLAADGVAGPQTEAALVRAGADKPPSSPIGSGGGSAPAAPVDTVLPRSGLGFYSYRLASRSYGTADTIRALTTIGQAWAAAQPGGPRIGIGEISLRGGGPIAGHVSHRKGIDVDLYAMRNDGAEKVVTWKDPAYSRTLTQKLVDTIRANGLLKVQYIFFNDSAVRDVSHWKNHDNHLHVRFFPASGGVSHERDPIFSDLETMPVAEWAEVAFEAAPQQNPLEKYRIRSGLYTREERRFAAEHPIGLIRTSSVVGKEERRLTASGPRTISIGKELTRFEDGKLGQFVATFNEFTYYFDEVLRGIGRLRDLVSAGCPEAPKLMTSRQQQALRPTDDRESSLARKGRYEIWRTSQQRFDTVALAVAGRARRVVESREAFWKAQGEMSRTLAMKLDKPKYQMVSVKIADIAAIVLAETASAAATGGLIVLGDLLLEARKNRKEYDAKMRDFVAALGVRKDLIKDQLATYRTAGQAYWGEVEDLQETLAQRDQARYKSRETAGLVGQSLAPPSESRGAVLGEIRMPPVIAEAWHVLALNGQKALAKLSAVIRARELVAKARFNFEKSRPDPWEAEDITKVHGAYKRALSWKGVLDPDQVKIWIATNNAWDERFNKYYR